MGLSTTQPLPVFGVASSQVDMPAIGCQGEVSPLQGAVVFPRALLGAEPRLLGEGVVHTDRGVPAKRPVIRPHTRGNNKNTCNKVLKPMFPLLAL